MFRKDNSEGGSSASALFTVCSSFSSGQYFGTALLCLLVIQNTSAVLLARHTRLKYNYNVDHMLLISEIMKLVTSIVLEALTFVKVEDEEKNPMTEGNNLVCVTGVVHYSSPSVLIFGTILGMH
jgi:hypothetical protein